MEVVSITPCCKSGTGAVWGQLLASFIPRAAMGSERFNIDNIVNLQ